MTAAVIVAIMSATIAACSLGYTVYDKRRSREQKRLSWTVSYNSQVMRSLSPRVQTLTVHLGNQVLKNPRVVAVEVRNTGNVTLTKDDISIPPGVHLPDGGILLGAEAILRTAGSNVDHPVKSTERPDAMTIEAEPVVLNPQDSLVFELFVDGGDQNPIFRMQAAGFTISETSRVAVVTTKSVLGSQIWIGVAGITGLIATILAMWSILVTLPNPR